MQNIKILANVIDHTFLPAITGEISDVEIKRTEELCEEAIRYGFISVCVRPNFIKYAKNKLSESKVKIATVIGFPENKTNKDIAIQFFGTLPLEKKLTEIKQALNDGADEFDIVVNIPDIKNNNLENLQKELETLLIAAENRLVKFIIETGILEQSEKIFAVKTIINITKEIRLKNPKKSFAVMVKTSTGMVNDASGATLEDVKLIKSLIAGYNIGIKASGGISDKKTAEEFLIAGVDRIGTSKSIQLV